MTIPTEFTKKMREMADQVHPSDSEKYLRCGANFIDQQAEEIGRMKETNKRLNRRCQLAEKAADQNIEVCRRKGISLGRGLANYGYIKAEEKLQKIVNWTKAYPLKVFPKPDLILAAKILKEHGMTLDSISADNMRHVLEGIAKIIEDDNGS